MVIRPADTPLLPPSLPSSTHAIPHSTPNLLPSTLPSLTRTVPPLLHSSAYIYCSATLLFSVILAATSRSCIVHPCVSFLPCSLRLHFFSPSCSSAPPVTASSRPFPHVVYVPPLAVLSTPFSSPCTAICRLSCDSCHPLSIPLTAVSQPKPR